MNETTVRSPKPGWLQQAYLRIVTWWLPKMIGTIAGMAIFFAAYFWVLNHPFSAVATMPFTAIDRWIGFQPGALPLYLSLWLYISLVPALLDSRREILSYALGAAAVSLTGLGIFLVYPNKVLPADIDLSLHPGFAFLKSVDASGNACPSLHAAFAVFSAFWLGYLLRQIGAGAILRVLNWLWCLGILYSTIATGQHVAIDMFAGAGLGAVVAAMQRRGKLGIGDGAAL